MPNCCNCSAPLPVSAVKCDYCGSRNDVDLTGVHYYTTHETDTVRLCPCCTIPMKTIDLGIEGKFYIERCEDCLGLFFDPGELEALLEYSVKNVFEINRSRLAHLEITDQNRSRSATYIKCPVCSTMMNRVNFGTKSGVVIDRCKEHGVWLDAGELRQLAEWMKAGGKILDQVRNEERKKEEMAAKLTNRQGQVNFGNAGEYDDINPFGLNTGPEPNLLEIVFKTVRFFTSK